MGIEAVSSSTSSAASYGTKDVRPAAEVTKVNAAAQGAPAQDFSTAAQVVEETQRAGNKPSESTVKQAVSDINKKINPNTVAQYGYHDDTNRVTIKIVDKDTEDVIKEFPAEETLDMIAKVWELAGMFVDEKG